MKRQCPSLQKSLDWCEGMPQYPGIRRRVYFCNKSLIVEWPELERDDFGRVASALLRGNFELAEGAFWQYLDINIDKSTVTSEPQGEAPSQTQLNKATFVHNGIDDQATAVAGLLSNADNVFVYEDTQGHFRVIGNNRWHTRTTTNQDQGQGTNPANTVINVEATDMIAPPYYNGYLTTEDGNVYPHIAMPEQEAHIVITNQYITLIEGKTFLATDDGQTVDIEDQEGDAYIEIEDDYITIHTD